MDALQRQARALGDPTRHRIFEFLADADAPASVADLTAEVGLHPNAVRQHLAKLVEAALVVETTAPPTGRGRPPLVYRIDPNVDPRWAGQDRYEQLALLLVEVVRTGDRPEEVGRRAGRGRRLVGPRHPAPIDRFVEQMAGLGFDPAATERPDRTTDVTLRHCPFATAAVADAAAVCGLHLGLARGIAEAIGGIAVTDLVLKDPRRAGCRLRCTTDPHEVAGAPATS
jgi:predicted ArsR family transcriptional regulator